MENTTKNKMECTGCAFDKDGKNMMCKQLREGVSSLLTRPNHNKEDLVNKFIAFYKTENCECFTHSKFKK